MRRPQQAVRTSTLISAISIGLAVLALGGVAFMTLFARRQGQAQLALGLYLLALGGALAFFLWTAGFGGNDFDALPLLVGPWYLLVGSVLLAVSLISRRQWMTGTKTTVVRTLLLAGPGAFLLILLLFALGSGEWRTTPFGLDLLVASWIVGAGIFFAGSRLVTK